MDSSLSRRFSRRFVTLLATVFALVVSTAWVPAHAVIVTVDADDYAIGTNVANALSGATMSQVVQDPGVYDPGTGILSPAELQRSDAVVVDGYDSLSTAFGWGWDLQQYAWCLQGHQDACYEIEASGFRALEIVFDTPTDFVQAGMHFNGLDPLALLAFDVNDNLLVYCFGLPYSGPSGSAGCDQFPLPVGGPPTYNQELWLSYSRPQADIARVLLGGSDTLATIFQISYAYDAHSVPEPGTLALLSLGLAGLGLSRRRKSD